MKRYLVFLLLVVAVGVSAVLAGSATFTGTLGAGDPTMPVVSISTPNCGTQLVTPVHYHTHTFTVDADGAYLITLVSTGVTPGFASMYVYAGSFDPNNGAVNCIAGSNIADPHNLSVALTAGVTYILVPFDDQFAQPGGDYTLNVSGPGNILIGDQTACTYPLPAGSVVYSVPAGAPTFYEADLGTKLNFDLPAGTWWISEFTGDFAKVWIACQGSPVYIPANAVAH